MAERRPPVPDPGSAWAAEPSWRRCVVEEVFDPAAAELFGLARGQVCVMIHCGSRGLGHQICGDHVRVMDTAMARLRCEPDATDRWSASMTIDV
ncbi:MAG TPA: RtcB family protein [Streptosporangiaceae bacterium]